MTRWFAAVTALISAVAFAAATSSGVSARSKVGAECSDSQFSNGRDPANPLLLPSPPGPNPINGASFFVDGPKHGLAAGEIAKLLGMNAKSFPESESWADFDGRIVPRALKSHPNEAGAVHLLEKIGRQPHPIRFSEFSAGGSPAAVAGQVHKIFCYNLQADPGTVPVMQTFFIMPHGKYCASKGEIAANESLFKRQVAATAQATGKRPSVWLLELDAVATSSCLGKGALPLWENELSYEIAQFAALPHTVVYVEGGYADANKPGYTARVLNAIGVNRIRGFYTNDTHYDWTSNEVKWGQKVSALTNGADFIVNTAQNGRGPKYNPHPGRQGVESLCNPPGRGLGPQITTQTGFRYADAFMWTYEPGKSSGSCHGGPPAGTFWLARALGLAKRANGQLGPGYPSRPY